MKTDSAQLVKSLFPNCYIGPPVERGVVSEVKERIATLLPAKVQFPENGVSLTRYDVHIPDKVCVQRILEGQIDTSARPVMPDDRTLSLARRLLTGREKLSDTAVVWNDRIRDVCFDPSMDAMQQEPCLQRNFVFGVSVRAGDGDQSYFHPRALINVQYQMDDDSPDSGGGNKPKRTKKEPDKQKGKVVQVPQGLVPQMLPLPVRK